MLKLKKANLIPGSNRHLQRKPPRGNDKPAGLFSKIKDIAGFGFSTIAIAISIFSFYFGTLRQVDEVSVIVNGFPEATLDSDNVIHVNANADFILVNGGNRDAAILEIGYKIKPLERPPEEKFDCYSDIFLHAKLYAFSEKPFVLKKSEIRPMSISSFTEERKEILFNEDFSNHNNDYVPVCLYFRIATPSRKDFRTLSYVSLAGILVGPEIRTSDDGTDYAVVAGQTYVLVRNSESILSDFLWSE